MHCVYELRYILIISIFNFIFIHFTNQIILKQSLAQKLKLISKFSTIMEQIKFHFGHTWDIKDEERMEKLLQGVIPLL